MLRLLQYYGQFQSIRGGLFAMPRWARVILLIFALPGIVLILLSIFAFLVSLLALLLLTVPVYRLLALVTAPRRRARGRDDIVVEQVGGPTIEIVGPQEANVAEQDVVPTPRRRIDVKIVE